jgi:hypothetical protein
VVLITHDPMEACRLSHRLLVLSPLPAGLMTGITFRLPRSGAVGQPGGAAATADEGQRMSAKLFRGAVVFCGLLLLWWLATAAAFPLSCCLPSAVASALWVNRAYLGGTR